MAIQGLVTNGWLVVLGMGPDGSLGRIVQTARHNAWSDWESIGPAIAGNPAVFHNPDKRVEVFARGPEGALGHMWEIEPEGDWSEWEDIGPAIQGDPVVFHNADGHLEVFGRGPDGVLGHIWQTEPEHGWSEWEDLGPAISGDPAVFQNADGRLELFASGPEGRLGHRWQLVPSGHTGWSDWEELGPVVSGRPVLFQNVNRLLEVFALGPDGVLGHRWQEDPDLGWSEWADLGPSISGDPAVFQNADGRLEAFARGLDGMLGHMWHTYPGGGWSEWEELGPAVLSDPVLFQNADGRLEVFAIGPDGLLGHRWQIAPGGGSGWTAWEVFGPAVSPERRLAVGQLGTIGRGDRDEAIEEEPQASPGARAPAELTADFCVIGAGPAGITVSEGLLRAGASVILVESGSLHIDPAAQELNEGHADGPIIKRRTTYLLDGRRRTVQGSAAAWGPAWCMPFRAIDFEARPWVAHSGWSLPEDLAQYEARAAATFGLEEFRPPRPDGGPLVRVSYQYPPDSFVFRAKYFDLLTKPRFHPELGATAVDLKARGDRIDSVRLVRARGDEVHVKADTVVLAAGGVENARMLLLHEHTLATSAMTGRCFMEHPHVQAGRVRLPDADAVRLCLEAESDSELEVLALDDASQSEERLLNATVQLQPRGWDGSASGPVECDLYVRAEQAPNPDSRVVLGDRVDRLGCPQPVLHWRLLPHDWTSIVRTAELTVSALEERHGAEGWVSLRSNQPWPLDPAGPAEAAHATWGNHHMGTTRMADRPTDGVVDPDCRVHGTPNLYVAGSSVFPTGSCANPTFMIVALAHRLVDHLSERRADQPRTTVNKA